MNISWRNFALLKTKYKKSYVELTATYFIVWVNLIEGIQKGWMEMCMKEYMRKVFGWGNVLLENADVGKWLVPSYPHSILVACWSYKGMNDGKGDSDSFKFSFILGVYDYLMVWNVFLNQQKSLCFPVEAFCGVSGIIFGKLWMLI